MLRRWRERASLPALALIHTLTRSSTPQYSGYGKAGFARRMRVYTISDYGERVTTHHLMDDMKRDHETVLVGEDAMGEAR